MSCAIPRRACPMPSWKRPVIYITFETRTVNGGSKPNESLIPDKVYWYVAKESPHGEGSISMLEHLLTWWKGKLFVLVLLGFVATDFIITITLSAADATAHLIENPFAPHVLHGQHVGVTLFLIALLGAVFLKGFKEAIGIAVL